MKRVLLLFGLILMFLAPQASAAEATFENLVPPAAYTGPGGGAYYKGSDGANGFASGDAWFGNSYYPSYGGWAGFAYSNTTDTATSGYTNQFSAYTGGGAAGSVNYAVGYQDSYNGVTPTASFGAVTGEDYDTTISGMYVTNTTYAALSMLHGNDYPGKKFGGADGNDEDWFLLTITGITEAGYTANRVEFYLADYRFADNSLDYVVDTWEWVDLTGLGNVVGLEFSLTSSDNGAYGMNTPAYFAMDNLNGSQIPVPGAIILLGSGLLGLVGIRRKL